MFWNTSFLNPIRIAFILGMLSNLKTAPDSF